mgnify:CR=1 FL=1
MVNGLLQLVASGSQDLYLIGNPDITLFKTIYRRPVNFSMEETSISLRGKNKFGYKQKAVIPQKGDLLNSLKLYVQIPQLRLSYKYSSSDEITNLLRDNNASHYTHMIYDTNIDKLYQLQDINNQETSVYLVILPDDSYQLTSNPIKAINFVSSTTTGNVYINPNDINLYLVNLQEFLNNYTLLSKSIDTGTRTNVTNTLYNFSFDDINNVFGRDCDPATISRRSKGF